MAYASPTVVADYLLVCSCKHVPRGLYLGPIAVHHLDHVEIAWQPRRHRDDTDRLRSYPPEVAALLLALVHSRGRGECEDVDAPAARGRRDEVHLGGGRLRVDVFPFHAAFEIELVGLGGEVAAEEWRGSVSLKRPPPWLYRADGRAERAIFAWPLGQPPVAALATRLTVRGSAKGNEGIPAIINQPKSALNVQRQWGFPDEDVLASVHIGHIVRHVPAVLHWGGRARRTAHLQTFAGCSSSRSLGCHHPQPCGSRRAATDS